MDFDSITLSSMIKIVENGLSTSFYGSGTTLKKTVLKVMARVIGAVAYLLVLSIKKIWSNRFISTCSVSELDSFGTEYGLPHKGPGNAHGSGTVTATTAQTLAQGTALIDEDTGMEYIISVTATIAAGSNTVKISANDPGASSNMDAGTTLSFRDSTPDGIEDNITIGSDGLTGGIVYTVAIDGQDEEWGETAEEYRARLLERRQNQPQGGCDADYVGWAKRFSQVTNCFAFGNKPNVNSVSVVCANRNRSNPALTSDEISEVNDYIQSPSRRPITADVRVFSCTGSAIKIILSAKPYTDSVKSSIRSAIKKYLYSFGPEETITEDAIRIAAIAGSKAESITVTSLTQDGVAVSEITLGLTYPSGGSPVGQVAYFDDADSDITINEAS
jgi:uncharacterized phage protein gp47/JayE